MARFQEPNPLDLFFYAADSAMRRLGLPGAHVHLCLDLEGRVDETGLKQALDALRHVYPATGSRLECHPITGRPRWRLDVPPPDFDRIVQTHQLAPANEDEYHRRIEILLNKPIVLGDQSPLRFHVFRGLPTGDRLVVRWPHAFMDGRGGVTLLEEIDRLYQQKPSTATLVSLGDEDRRDFTELISRAPQAHRPWTAISGEDDIRPKRWRTTRLADGISPSNLGAVRYLAMALTREQTRHAKEASLRVCGFARFGDFMRACAIRALDRVMPRPLPPDGGYCTLNLIDHRKRRQNAPVCRNLTNALPLYIPVPIAPNLRATADLLREQTATLLQSGAMVRRLVTARTMTALPTSLLANLMYHAMMRNSSHRMPAGMGDAPSLPLGLIGSFSREMPAFCGAGLNNILGLRPVPFQTGISVDVNEAQEHINIAVMFYESCVRINTIESFLQSFQNNLLQSQ